MQNNTSSHTNPGSILLFQSLSYKTVSKPTRYGSHSESKDVKNNKQGSPCVSALRSCAGQRLHSSLKPTHWISSCSEFPWLLPFFETFWSLLLLIFPGSPLIRSVRHTVQIVTSWKWTFPEAGVSLQVGGVTAERRNCPFNAALFNILYRNSILHIYNVWRRVTYRHSVLLGCQWESKLKRNTPFTDCTSSN